MYCASALLKRTRSKIHVKSSLQTSRTVHQYSDVLKLPCESLSYRHTGTPWTLAGNGFKEVRAMLSIASWLECWQHNFCRSPIDHGSGMITEVRPEKNAGNPRPAEMKCQLHILTSPKFKALTKKKHLSLINFRRHSRQHGKITNLPKRGSWWDAPGEIPRVGPWCWEIIFVPPSGGFSLVVWYVCKVVHCDHANWKIGRLVVLVGGSHLFCMAKPRVFIFVCYARVRVGSLGASFAKLQ